MAANAKIAETFLLLSKMNLKVISPIPEGVIGQVGSNRE